MKSLLNSAFALTIILFTACDNNAVINDLDAAKAAWDGLNANKYAYDYSYGCHCIRDYVPARLIVENGVITAVNNPSTGQPFAYPNGTLVVDSLPPMFYTIDELFAELEDAEQNAFSTTADYDSISGYPKSMYIDWNAQLADDEFSYEVSNFVKM
jgi:hypothetical protein